MIVRIFLLLAACSALLIALSFERVVGVPIISFFGLYLISKNRSWFVRLALLVLFAAVTAALYQIAMLFSLVVLAALLYAGVLPALSESLSGKRPSAEVALVVISALCIAFFGGVNFSAGVLLQLLASVLFVWYILVKKIKRTGSFDTASFFE